MQTLPERKEYEHLVSDKCAGCLEPITKSILRYEQEGNYCKKCLVKVNAKLKKKTLSEEELDKIFRPKL